jgi:peptidoglycan/LPS O-acetylase OafA/YrhL
MVSLIEQQTASEKTSKIESIDGLRAVAALAVVLSHSFYLHNGQVNYLGFKLINAFFYSHGISAVLIFFMLSGLCIHLPIANGKPFKIGAFFIRRSLRILPTLIVAYGFIYYLRLLKPSVDFDAPTWSLWVELLYYAIYPLLYIISTRISTINLSLISISISVSATCLLNFPTNFHGGNNILYNALMGLCYWIAGMVLAEIIAKKKEPKLPRFLLLINLGILRSLLVLLDAAAYTLYHLYKLPYTVSLASISPLLFLYVYKEIQETKFNYIFVSIGIFSYSLYLFHQPIMQLLNSVDSEFTTSISALVVVIATCYIPYLLIEKPSIEVIKKLKLRNII